MTILSFMEVRNNGSDAIEAERIAKVRTKWESNILVADLFLTSGYVSAWKHVAGIKLCARTAEALEDLLIQIAQAYIPNDDLIVRIPENEAEGELWSYEM